MPTREELVKAIRDAAQSVGGLRLVYLFGSRARGTARPGSDVDVALLFEEELSPREREQLRRKLLGELAAALGKVGERTDVVDLHRAGSSLAFRVIREGHCLWSCDEAVRLRFEARAARRYDDDSPKRQLFRRAALRVGRAMKGMHHG